MIDSIKVIESLTDLQERVTARSDLQEVMNQCLESLLSLTQSSYGFIGTIEKNSSQKYLKTLSISNISWNDETRKFYEENFKKGMEFYNLETLFGEVIKTEHVVISNNPKEDSRAGGIPEEHPPLNSFLGIPFHHDKKFIGMCGIANSPEGYSFESVAKLRILCKYIEKLIFTHLQSSSRGTAQEFIKNEFLENIIDASMEGIISIDRHGIIQSINKSACNLFGYSKPELMGQNIKVLVPYPHKDKHDGYLNNYMKSMHSDIFNIERELKAEKKDGSLIDIHLTVSKISSDDKQDIQLIGFFKDLSGHREYLEKLQKARIEAELGEKAKINFIGLISHELRTPLNGIIGPLQLLEESELADEHKEILNVAMNSANSLLSQLNRILEFSSISAGLLKPEESFFSSIELKAIVRQGSKQQILNKQLELQLEGFEKEHFYKGDLRLISQTLQSLVDNAIKYTDSGIIKVVFSTNELNEEEDEVTIKVIDSGVGISKDKRKSIFSNFTQADLSMTRNYQGLGLGLSLAQQTAHLLGGDVELESSTRKGSCFNFRLPLLKVNPEDISKENITTFPQNVLIVEDNPTTQKILKQMMKRDNTGLSFAYNGHHALKKIKSHKYDLIFMDLIMPYLNGLECCEEIRKLGYKMPVIAMSSSENPEVLNKFENYNFQSFIKKPITRRNILEIYDKYLK